jgi:VanZ family protein
MKTNFFTSLLSFLPAAVWAGLIYFLSAQQALPSLTLSLADFLFKKTAHIFVYTVLYFLLIRGFAKLHYKFEKIWLLALVICVSYASLDELHQSTVAGRTATLIDVGFDFSGASLVSLRKFNYI